MEISAIKGGWGGRGNLDKKHKLIYLQSRPQKKLRYQTFFYLHSATFFFVEFISQNNDNMNSVLNSLLRNVFFLNVNVNIFPIVQTKTINGGRRKYTLTCT